MVTDRIYGNFGLGNWNGSDENAGYWGGVYGVKSLEKVTFINVGAKYPNAPLTIVIFAKDLANFKDTPEKLYGNHSICVTGVLKEYKGKTEIIVSKPDEIVAGNWSSAQHFTSQSF